MNLVKSSRMKYGLLLFRFLGRIYIVSILQKYKTTLILLFSPIRNQDHKTERSVTQLKNLLFTFF